MKSPEVPKQRVQNSSATARSTKDRRGFRNRSQYEGSPGSGTDSSICNSEPGLGYGLVDECADLAQTMVNMAQEKLASLRQRLCEVRDRGKVLTNTLAEDRKSLQALKEQHKEMLKAQARIEVDCATLQTQLQVLDTEVERHNTHSGHTLQEAARVQEELEQKLAAQAKTNAALIETHTGHKALEEAHNQNVADEMAGAQAHLEKTCQQLSELEGLHRIVQCKEEKRLAQYLAVKQQYQTILS